MAPQDLNQIKAIIEMVNARLIKSIDHAIAGQDELRKLIDRLSQERATQQERVKSVEEDVRHLSEKIDKLEENIINSQKKRFTQVIATQGALLFLIIAGFISYLFSLPPFHR